MTPHEVFLKGELGEALALQFAVVQDTPQDAAARVFLAELLTFAGRRREACEQLHAVDCPEAGWNEWRDHFCGLLRAEGRRNRRGCRPMVMQVPSPVHVRWQWRALRALRQGDTTAAIRYCDRAEAGTPELRGFVNGQEFAGLRDVDDVTASVLEAFAGGRWLWLPWGSLRRVTLQPARFPRHQWCRPAELRLRDGSTAHVELPMLYPRSSRHDAPFALGLDTDYVAPRGGPLRGVGGKILLCGDGEIPLREVSMLEFRG